MQKDLNEYIEEVDKEREAERSKKNQLLQQLAAYGGAGHEHSSAGAAAHSPGRGIGKSPSGGLANKFSKYSI